MCKLLIAIQKIPNDPNLRELVKIQNLKDQPHGAGAMATDDNGKIEVCRSVSNYQKVFNFANKKLKTSKIVALHTRTSTGGTINDDNVHFFSDKNRFFAHNGWISSYERKNGYWWNNYEREDTMYSGYFRRQSALIPKEGEDSIAEEIATCYGCNTDKKGYCKRHIKDGKRLFDDTDDYKEPEKPKKSENKKLDNTKCDSLQFLEDIPDKYDVDTLEEMAKKKKFFGVAFLADEATKKQYVLVRNKTAHLCVGDNYALITSFEPKTESDIWSNSFGIPYREKTKKAVTGKTFTIPDGVRELKL